LYGLINISINGNKRENPIAVNEFNIDA
jgi:hypothetical protein